MRVFVAFAFVLLVFPDARADDKHVEKLAAVYANVERLHFAGAGPGMAFPFDPKHGRKLRAMLPARYTDAGALAGHHATLLASGLLNRLQATLARTTLACAQDALRPLMKTRPWRKFGLAGRRQLAAVLATAPALTAADLQRADPTLSDPVLLVALMVKTGHTFGAPPHYLAKEDAKVPAAVSKHWREWLAKVWPERRKKKLSEQRAAEAAEIRKLWDVKGKRAQAWLRHAAAQTMGIESYLAWIGYDAKLQARVWKNTRSRPAGQWFANTPPAYGP